MFVFRQDHLPTDAAFPANLEVLGYFLNDQDEIRKIKSPSEGFQYRISSSERWNERNKDAMNACIREIVLSRLHDLGMRTLRLPTRVPLQNTPQGVFQDRTHRQAPHVPILVSPNLSTANRVLVVFGEPAQDLGIWAYRIAGRDSVNGGSLVNLVRCILQPDTELPQLNPSNPMFPMSPLPITPRTDQAIVIANTGQLIWHCGSQTAMTNAVWTGMPRESAVEGPLAMSRRNVIPRNKNWQEHVECVFEDVLSSKSKLIKDDAKIDIIGVAEGGFAALKVLSENWSTYNNRINGICIADPIHNKQLSLSAFKLFEPLPPTLAPALGKDKEEGAAAAALPPPPPKIPFSEFISTRCRAYLISQQPRDEPVPGRSNYGCNCYSSGEKLNAESIGAMAWPSMVKWLDKLYANPEHREDEVFIAEESIECDPWDQWRKYGTVVEYLPPTTEGKSNKGENKGEGRDDDDYMKGVDVGRLQID